MNRILIDEAEAADGARVTLSGRRAEHVRDVLRGAPGQSVRVGLLNGPRGVARVEALDAETLTLHCEWEPAPPPRSRVHLVLSLPRPKVLKRVWAMLASLGVRTLTLVNAAKVERNYFDTHWLLPEYYQPLLREGLEQSGDTWLPDVRIERRFRPFVEDRLDGLCKGAVRVVAHPGDAAVAFRGLDLPAGSSLVLAVGPEGGWTEFELDLLERSGFRRISLGWRRLRSDTACAALLALAHDALGG